METRTSLQPAGMLLVAALLVVGLTFAVANLTAQQTSVFYLAAALLFGGSVGLHIKTVAGSGGLSLICRMVLCLFPLLYVVYVLPHPG